MSATWRQNLLISHLRIQESRQSQQGGRLFLSRIGRCQFGLEDGLSHLRGCLDHLRPQRAALLGQLLFAQDGTKLIARLQKVTGMAEYQARRVAQTERTRVQSQARADALHEAAGMGITVTKRWSTRMVRSRDSHVALNGVEIPENEKFVTIWGNTLDYPGDPSAPAREVVNCHCVLVPDVKTSAANPGEYL